MGSHQGLGSGAPGGGRARQVGPVQRGAGSEPQRAAVFPGDRLRDAREQRVHLGNRPPADEGKRAAQPVAQAAQARGKARRHHHLVGRRGEIEQGAVDVEQQRGALRRRQRADHVRQPTTRTS